MSKSSLRETLRELEAAADAAGGGVRADWPVGKRMAFYTFIIVFFLGMFDMIDRQILAVLFPYIKAEYGLSDAQLGSLMSILNVSLAVLVIPSGYLIDRWSRKKMMFLMAAIWSAATAACAFAGSYAQLLIARFVCGAGEAGYNPAAQSLLAYQFPERMRTTAAGLAQFGMGVGTPVGLILGAYIATRWGWRYAFGIVAIPGFLLALLALTIKDFKTLPPSREGKQKRGPDIKYLAGFFTRPTLLCVYLAAAVCTMCASLSYSWLPSYFNRVAQLPMTTASLFASLCMVFSVLALLLAGPPVDRIRRSRPNGGAICMCVGLFFAASLVPVIYGVLTPGSMFQVGLLAIINIFPGANAAVGFALAIDLSASDERATAISMIVFVQNILGMALGPVLAGIIYDRFDLSTALLSISVIGYGIAALLYFIAIFTFGRDMAKKRNVEVVQAL